MFHKVICILLLSRLVFSDFDYEQSFPDSVHRCFDDAKTEQVDMDLAKRACIMAYFTEVSKPRSLTAEDKAFFQRRIDARFGLVPPKTGFRLRREIRTLSIDERQRLTSVLKTMYQTGTLQRFGRLHGQTAKKVHYGAAFLPWHRIFILDFEEEMRRIDSRVFLPYWDYTIDNNITRPSDSVLWTDCFFGNGEGYIESGPFKNWYGGHSIQMRRDYAIGGQCPPRLINKLDIKGILQKCYFKEVTTGNGPFFENIHNIEMLHDGVHDWVGGDFDELAYSAYDPVFYMHHAFIDFIWEQFRRQQQKRRCKVNPEKDWRPKDDLSQEDREGHGPFDTMFGYYHLRNIDGCWKNWTRLFYDYEDQPSCPYCSHSEFLYCDKSADPRYAEGICLTKTKEACHRQGSSFKNEISLGVLTKKPLLHTHTVELLKGIRGDGRSRDKSIMECDVILRAEIAKGLPQNTTSQEIQTDPTNSLLHYSPRNPRVHTVSTSMPNTDKHMKSKGHTITRKACAQGCIGLTVVGLSFVALLFTIVACAFIRKINL